MIFPERGVFSELKALVGRRRTGADFSVIFVVIPVADAPNRRETLFGGGFVKIRSAPNRIRRVIVEPEPALDSARCV